MVTIKQQIMKHKIQIAELFSINGLKFKGGLSGQAFELFSP